MNAKVTRLLALVAAAIVLTVGPALIQGKLMRRWERPTDSSDNDLRPTELPSQIGDWVHNGDEKPLPEDLLKELGVSSYASRTYTNPRTGRQVQVLLMVGQPGPLARHPPELCYAMAGNLQTGESATYSLTHLGTEHRFNVIRFVSSSVLVHEFCVCYGFFDGTGWDVPQFPRIVYGAQRSLHKIQVLCNATNLDEEDHVPGPVDDFLQAFIAQMFQGV